MKDLFETVTNRWANRLAVAICCTLFFFSLFSSNASAYSIVNWSGGRYHPTGLAWAQSYDDNTNHVYYADANSFSFTVMPDEATTDPTAPVAFTLSGLWSYEKLPSGPSGPSWNKIEMWIGLDTPAVNGSRPLYVMDYMHSEASAAFNIPMTITPGQVVNGMLFADTYRSYDAGYNMSYVRLDSIIITTEESVPVPLPGTVLLLGSGFLTLAGFRGKSKK